MDEGQTALRLLALAYPLAGVGVVVSAAFQSVGRARDALLLTVGRHPGQAARAPSGVQPLLAQRHLGRGSGFGAGGLCRVGGDAEALLRSARGE